MPMTSEQSQRFGELFEQYNAMLVCYAYGKLTKAGVASVRATSLAEDLAQEAWLDVARSGAKDLLRPGYLSAEDTRICLYARVKTRVVKHFRRRSTSEQPVDWEDPRTCFVLCPSLPEQCALAAPSESLLQLVSSLPEREQEALLASVDGRTDKAVAALLGCTPGNARKLIDTAVLRLQLCHPKAAPEPVAVESLPAPQQEALARLEESQREALLRIDDKARQVLLLHLAEGLDSNAIAARLGVARSTIAAAYKSATSLAGPDCVAGRGLYREKGALARKLAHTLRSEVEALQPGEQLPTENALIARFGCSSKTLRDALRMLRTEGLVTTGAGRRRVRSTDELAVAA